MSPLNKQEEKYCPNCLRLCTKSKYAKEGSWQLGCEPCGILLYSPAILLDTPDKEASQKYRLKEYLKHIVRYDIRDEDIENIIIDIKNIIDEVETL